MPSVSIPMVGTWHWLTDVCGQQWLWILSGMYTQKINVIPWSKCILVYYCFTKLVQRLFKWGVMLHYSLAPYKQLNSLIYGLPFYIQELQTFKHGLGFLTHPVQNYGTHNECTFHKDLSIIIWYLQMLLLFSGFPNDATSSQIHNTTTNNIKTKKHKC